MTDAELLYQLKSGNRVAFSELVASYQKAVINICYRFLLNKEDAEDISQEVFLEVFYSIKNFRGDSKLSTWIYRIATSKSLDEIKKQTRKKRFSFVARTLGIEQITNLVISNERPDKSMEEIEDFSRLMEALNKLPQSQRIALSLSKIDGCSSGEIADIMQTTLTGVDSLIYRAKQNLKIFLMNNRQK